MCPSEDDHCLPIYTPKPTPAPTPFPKANAMNAPRLDGLSAVSSALSRYDFDGRHRRLVRHSGSFATLSISLSGRRHPLLSHSFPCHGVDVFRLRLRCHEWRRLLPTEA